MRFITILLLFLSIPSIADDVFVHEQTLLNFPSQLANMKREEITEYPDPSAGISINYRATDGTLATVFIYNRGLQLIPSGGESELIKNEMIEVIRSIKYLESQGVYSDLHILGGEPIALSKSSDIKWSRVAFVGSAKSNLIVSRIYITSIKDNFIKIRLTTPDGESKYVDSFPEAIGDLVANAEK